MSNNKNNNSIAIMILCSHLIKKENIKPLEPKEWSLLVTKLLALNIEPYQLLNFSSNDFKEYLSFTSEEIERFNQLISRSAGITFEIDKLSKLGIKFVTRADRNYPKQIKKKLGNDCPPIFYYAGNLSLLENQLIGFVGSRTTDTCDELFTENLVKKVASRNYGIVSGGAKGVDSISSKTAKSMNSIVVEFVSDSLIKRIKDSENINLIRNDKLLLLSVVNPNSGFNTGIAMMNNKYIYASSIGTFVIKSDYKKGGTWAGASENIKKKFSNTYCWNNSKYIGNMELIKKGAIPFDDTWDGNLEELDKEKPEVFEQTTLTI